MHECLLVPVKPKTCKLFCSFLSGLLLLLSFPVSSFGSSIVQFETLTMSEPWNAQSWAASGWQQSGWYDSTNQWYESEHRYGYDSRQSTLGDADLPSHFKPSKNYLDETLVYRSTLKRYIDPSAWSRAKGIAGKPVQDVKLTDLTHKGIQEWMIRGLSRGKFSSFAVSVAGEED